MNKFEMMMKFLVVGEGRKAMAPQASAHLYVMASLMAKAYASGAITYKCTVYQSIWDEFIAQVRESSPWYANELAGHHPGAQLCAQVLTIGIGLLI